MGTFTFVAFILISGAISGLVLGLVNLATVEPYLDAAIEIEIQNMLDSGYEAPDDFFISQQEYRDWQKGGQMLASMILGVAMSSLFGIVFALSSKMLPSTNNIKKTLVLCGIMWLVIFFIPFLKYPANPPTVGDPDTIDMRTSQYVAFVAISGFGAAGMYQISKRMAGKKKVIGVCGYAILITATFAIMPSSPDEATIDAELLEGFRLASATGMSIFWGVLAIVFGSLWQRFGTALHRGINSDSKIRE